MAVIFTYPKVQIPDVLDLLLITDVSDNNKTKQTTIKGLKDAIDVVDSITVLNPLFISSPTGDVQISLKGVNGFGTEGQVLAVNAAQDGLEYVDGGGGGGSISVKDASTTVDPTKILNFTGKIFTVTADAADATQADVAGAYNTLIPDATLTVKDVGSIPSGTAASTLKSNDIVDLFDKIFFPTVPPIYVNPTFSITKNQPGPFEPGAQVSNMGITLQFINKDSAGFDTGQGMTLTRSNPQATLVPASTTSTTLANLAPQFPSSDPNPNNPQERQTYTYSDSFIVDNTYTAVSQSVTYTGGASYLAGGILQDSAGNPSPPSTIPPSPITGSTSFTVLYPWFWGISTESAGGIRFPTSGYATSVAKVKQIIEGGGLTGYSYNKELESSTGTISAAFNNTSGGTWMWFAHPAANTTKTIWYESATANGNIGGILFQDPPDSDPGANLFSAPSTQTITTLTAFGWTHPYKIYIALKSASTTTIELRNL